MYPKTIQLEICWTLSIVVLCALIGMMDPIQAKAQAVEIYWADEFRIHRVDADGENKETLLSVGFPVDMALDTEEEKLYWTSSSGLKIEPNEC